MNAVDKDFLATVAASDPDFAKYITTQTGETFDKQMTVSDVHVASASSDVSSKEKDEKKKGKQPKPAMRNFAALVAEAEGEGQTTVGEPALDVSAPLSNRERARDVSMAGDSVVAPKPISKTFTEIMAGIDTTKQAERYLKPHEDGGAHTPFPYDAQALDKIPPEQVHRFFSALTNQDNLPTRSIPINSLVAMQPRVSPTKVQDMRDNGYAKLPLVVRNDGRNYLADGHHRATAVWLDGDDMLDAKFVSLRGDDAELMKIDASGKWEMRFPVTKIDADQQLVFGWASIVQEGDYLIVDKQGDMILPEELERAAYDYVLEARQHGDMHATVGTGRLVESMMFTEDKQKALGVTLKNENGQQIVGWWAGFKVDNPEVWLLHKDGKRLEFSIGGHSLRVPVEDLEGLDEDGDEQRVSEQGQDLSGQL